MDSSVESNLSGLFAQSAFSITTLYKEAIKQQKRAYQAGYDQCLQDLWTFVSGVQRQEGVPIAELVAFFSKKHHELQAANATDSEPQVQQQQQQQRTQEPSAQLNSPHTPNVHQPAPTHTTNPQTQTLPQADSPHIPTCAFTFSIPTSDAQYPADGQNSARAFAPIPPHLAPSMQNFQQQQCPPATYDGGGTPTQMNQDMSSPLKRRWLNTGNEVAFMGRSFNWNDPALEPAYKRSRFRRDKDDMSNS